MSPEQVLAKLKKDLDLWIRGNSGQKIQHISGRWYDLPANPQEVTAWKCVLKHIERLEKRDE